MIYCYLCKLWLLFTSTHLGNQCSLGGEAVLQEEGALGAAQTVQNDFQHSTQDALPGL